MSDTQTSCPIWGTGAVRSPINADGLTVNSARTAGPYFLSHSAGVNLRSESDEFRALLTTWLVDQRRQGIEAPKISASVLDQVRLQRPLPLSAKVDRFFLFVSAQRLRLGQELVVELDGGPGEVRREELSAWTECANDSELEALTGILANLNLITEEMNGYIELSPSGYERLEAIERGNSESNSVFIAMWFDFSMEDAYSQGIEKAVTQAGYKAVRIDRKEHVNKIDDEIIAEIRRSKFVVADFTCGISNRKNETIASARGGVYFEAGLAVGLGLPVIWCCRQDCLPYVHFDTRQFAHIVWGYPIDLRTRLYNRIASVIGLAPGVASS